jgi:uncharacterized tellurite resistance protein B-like protein
MSLLQRLGLSSGGQAPRSRLAGAIRERLDRLPPARAEFMAAFAGLLVRVAYADHQVSTHERERLPEILVAHAGLTSDEAGVIADVVIAQATALTGIDYSALTGTFNEVAGEEEKKRLIDCLYAVATADDAVSVPEDEEIRKVSHALLLSHADFIAIRARYKEQLEVIRALRRQQGS